MDYGHLRRWTLVSAIVNSKCYLSLEKNHLIREIHTKGGENVIGLDAALERLITSCQRSSRKKENKSLVNNVQRGLYLGNKVKVLGDHETPFLT